MAMSEQTAAINRATVEQVCQSQADLIGGIFAAGRAKREAKAQAEADRYQQIESQRLIDSNNILRGNVDVADSDKGMVMASTQIAVKILMDKLNMNFEEVREMIFNHPDYNRFESDLMDASIKRDQSFKKGFMSGAKEIVDRL